MFRFSFKIFFAFSNFKLCSKFSPKFYSVLFKILFVFFGLKFCSSRKLFLSTAAILANTASECRFVFFFNQSLIFVHKFSLPRALLALRQCLPDQLRDITFATCLQEDQSTKHWLNQLLKNLETGPQQPPTQPGQPDPRTIGMSPLTS